MKKEFSSGDGFDSSDNNNNKLNGLVRKKERMLQVTPKLRSLDKRVKLKLMKNGRKYFFVKL